MQRDNNTLYIILGVAIIIFILWLVVRFIGYIFQYKLIVGIVIAVIIGVLIYFSRRNNN